jgi:[acyl-carrier-protein] S-malonyltransferase
MDFERARTVVVFPGQSSREGATGELLEEWRPRLFETLSRVVGDDPFARAEVSQAAEQAVTVSCSLACWHAQGSPTPRYMLGHSLGELTALAAAGVIAEDEAVRLAALRGELVDRACDATPGGMVAVRAALFDIEGIAAEYELAVAFHNGPRQVVMAGAVDALERAQSAFAQAGIGCTDLELPGAFNSPLMEPAIAPFRAALEECELRPPQAIVYSAATCRPLIAAPRELARSLIAAVRWWETLARLAMEGVETFLEISVGGLLSPLPAGIVTERAARPPRLPRAAPGSEPAGASAGEPIGEPVFAYFDDENHLHVLV